MASTVTLMAMAAWMVAKTPLCEQRKGEAPGMGWASH